MGGQRMPMSLVEPWSPVPVLSPTRQLAGTPARRRVPPVVLARSHSVSWSREDGREGAAEQERVEIGDHGGGSGGVARIVGEGLVESGFDAVEAGDGVAERACELGEAGRAADVGEDEVGGGVVAVVDGGGADLRERHAGCAGVVLGDGRVGDEVGLLEDDALVETLLAGVDVSEYGSGGDEFEGAAHGEALVAAMEGADAGAGVEDGDAEASSAV